MRIPKYIDENIFPHVALAPIGQQAPGAYGYTFRVYRPSNAHYLGTFEQNVEKLLAWARREHADAYEVEKHYFTTKEHRKPYYRRDYILVVITDPVAQVFERWEEARELKRQQRLAANRRPAAAAW